MQPRCPEAPLSQDQVHMQFIMCVHTDIHCTPCLLRQCLSYSGTNVLCEDSCCKPHVAPRLLLLSRPNPYRLRFKHPQSRCFQREWLYGSGLSFKTPRVVYFHTALCLYLLGSVNKTDYRLTVNSGTTAMGILTCCSFWFTLLYFNPDQIGLIMCCRMTVYWLTLL